MWSTTTFTTLYDTLRATHLRKHIATTSVSLNLDGNEISQLQNFLGHEDKIHKNYYRQPIIMDDIVKMSKLLEIAQGDSTKSNAEECNTEKTIIHTTQRQNISENNTFSTPERPTKNSSTNQESDENSNGSCYNPMDLEESNGDSDDSSHYQITKKRKRRRLLDKPKVKNPWSTPERAAVRSVFREYISCQGRNNSYPTNQQPQNAIDTTSALKDRSPK
ncbi:unnamed protein product [Phaedon cochleariae]|uniref:Uncharacterized protein n=1 Tax=Phaedon cochleariae TaxID=80249 RepID=A0A9N9X1W8_PHACE|nr:unnamed protein product [Phaedon cochleariae]